MAGDIVAIRLEDEGKWTEGGAVGGEDRPQGPPADAAGSPPPTSVVAMTPLARTDSPSLRPRHRSADSLGRERIATPAPPWTQRYVPVPSLTWPLHVRPPPPQPELCEVPPQHDQCDLWITPPL